MTMMAMNCKDDVLAAEMAAGLAEAGTTLGLDDATFDRVYRAVFDESTRLLLGGDPVFSHNEVLNELLVDAFEIEAFDTVEHGCKPIASTIAYAANEHRLYSADALANGRWIQCLVYWLASEEMDKQAVSIAITERSVLVG